MNATVQLTENSLSDGDLLDAWTGDQHGPSLAELVQLYSRMVLSVCRRRCRSEADADDAYQTTFLYLARNAGRIRNPECLPGWLHRVAQRAATATLHNKHSQVEPMVEPPAIPDDPLERLTKRHQAIALDEELADLPADYRAAIVMHLYEGLSVQILADRFDTTAGSIRGKLQRGKKLLARRLRRRGIVPVVAFAAANTWSVSEVQSVAAAETFTLGISDAGLPDPPINYSLLDSLLAKGVQFMPTITTTTGVLGGAALIAALMMTTGTQGQSEPDKKVMSLPAAEVASDAIFQVGSVGGAAQKTDEAKPDPKPGSPAIEQQRSGATTWVQKVMVPKPDSETATAIQSRLESPIEGPLNLERLMDMPGVPVFLDHRAIAEAKIDLEADDIKFDGKEMPLRSALRKMLRPHALTYEVENDGLVITADFEELSHRGFPMSRWIDADQESQDVFERELNTETTHSFDQTPLDEAIRTISEGHGIPMVVDRVALEEIGLSAEEPVTLSLERVSLRSLLRLMLRDLDLTYTSKNQVMEITTIDKAEKNLLSRIYWLDGTGFPAGDFDSLIEMIETTITPNTWESLGGPSNIQPLNQKRKAIIVSTRMEVHDQIERLLTVFRESNFGQQAVIQDVEVPRRPGQMLKGGRGYGFGGGGFGGGGGGNF